MSRKNVFAGEEEPDPDRDKRTAEDIMGKYHEMYSFLYLNYVVLIVALEWESQISLLCQELNEACKAACRITDADVTAGIGGIYGRFEELKYSFEEAQNALEYSTLLQKKKEGLRHTLRIWSQKTLLPGCNWKSRMRGFDECRKEQ